MVRNYQGNARWVLGPVIRKLGPIIRKRTKCKTPCTLTMLEDCFYIISSVYARVYIPVSIADDYYYPCEPDTSAPQSKPDAVQRQVLQAG